MIHAVAWRTFTCVHTFTQSHFFLSFADAPPHSLNKNQNRGPARMYEDEGTMYEDDE